MEYQNAMKDKLSQY